MPEECGSGAPTIHESPQGCLVRKTLHIWVFDLDALFHIGGYFSCSRRSGVIHTSLYQYSKLHVGALNELL